MKTVLDIREWYSIENVCSAIKGSISDIHEFLEGKQLAVYGRLKSEELLAYSELSSSGRYCGKAKVNYIGLVKLNKFKLSAFIKQKTIEASSVSILNSKGLYSIKTEDDFPSWIYESQISKWKSIDKEESFLDFEYCAFPTKSKSGACYFGDAMDMFERFSNGVETNEPSKHLIEYRESLPQYNVNTSLIFKGNSILFARAEIETLLANDSPKDELGTKFLWYSSFKRKDKLKKIIELLSVKNKSASATELWELLKKDSDSQGIYDPDCIVEEIVGDYLHIEGKREIKFKTFCNSVYKCKAYIEGQKT